MEKHEFGILLRTSRGDAVVLLATFLLVIFRDLTEGILVGFGLGALLFLHRMAQAVEIDQPRLAGGEDRPDSEDRTPYDAALATDPDILVYRITGAFFFGAAPVGVVDLPPGERSARMDIIEAGRILRL